MSTDNPHVLCVMLANGRPAMVERAIRSFRAQAYEPKTLLVFDSGSPRLEVPTGRGIYYAPLDTEGRARSIGELRNLANCFACAGALDAPVIAHWDSDDWSAPERLAEQAAVLESSQAEAVGYREMLFWDTRPLRHECSYDEREAACPVCSDEEQRQYERRGEAWLYSALNPRYCLGTSLCYWRRTWERRPFPEQNTGEDTLWTMKVKTAAYPALFPRMIASIHGDNTASKITPGAREWRRAPEWDAHCAERMAL